MKEYLVHKGIDWVDGRRVPSDRMVRLTASAARHYLDNGQISEKVVAEKTAPRNAVKAADGGA